MIACDFVLVLFGCQARSSYAQTSFGGAVAKKRYQAVGFPYNRMLKLSSSRRIRIDVPVLSISWSFVDHSVIIQAPRKGLIEREASDTGRVPRWKSSCPDRLAEAADPYTTRVNSLPRTGARQHVGVKNLCLKFLRFL